MSKFKSAKILSSQVGYSSWINTCSQRFCNDYNQKYALGSRMQTVRMILSLCAKFWIMLKQINITWTVLQGELKEEIYMRLQNGQGLLQGKTTVSPGKSAHTQNICCIVSDTTQICSALWSTSQLEIKPSCKTCLRGFIFFSYLYLFILSDLDTFQCSYQLITFFSTKKKKICSSVWPTKIVDRWNCAERMNAAWGWNYNNVAKCSFSCNLYNSLNDISVSDHLDQRCTCALLYRWWKFLVCGNLTAFWRRGGRQKISRVRKSCGFDKKHNIIKIKKRI